MDNPQITNAENIELEKLNEKTSEENMITNKDDVNIPITNISKQDSKKSSDEILHKKSNNSSNPKTPLLSPTHNYNLHSENDRLKSDARPPSSSLPSGSENIVEEEGSDSESELNLKSGAQSLGNTKSEKAFYLANVCLQLGNIDDAVHYSDEMVLTSEVTMTKEMQRVLIGSYSNLIVPLRSSWRKLCQIETEEKVAKKMINEIKIIKENLIISNCDKFIKMINENILTTKLDDEETALFLKVKADHYRYLAEITQGHQLYINKQNAFHFYKEAYLKAENFDDLNSTKLNIALNYSVFLYEILNKRINSFFYAKEALYKALRALKNCDEEELTNEEMRDTLMIIEVLNRNVEDWYKEEVGDIFESAKERIAITDKNEGMNEQ